MREPDRNRLVGERLAGSRWPAEIGARPLGTSGVGSAVSSERSSKMAEEALFIGWGEVVRGRERKAVDVFNESIEYYGRLQQDGKIEGFEAWFLAPHGGDLAGFVLLRGEREQLDEIQRSPEFERIQTRAGMIVDRTGTVNAYSGEALGRLMTQFQEAAGDLGA
jgi:hypothetical protein